MFFILTSDVKKAGGITLIEPTQRYCLSLPMLCLVPYKIPSHYKNQVDKILHFLNFSEQISPAGESREHLWMVNSFKSLQNFAIS